MRSRVKTEPRGFISETAVSGTSLLTTNVVAKMVTQRSSMLGPGLRAKRPDIKSKRTRRRKQVRRHMQPTQRVVSLIVTLAYRISDKSIFWKLVLCVIFIE